ncbi:interleukin-1 receptor type 2 [Tupaia chinensis]|uniref:Interleukin-1 receptor type 2 n=1 Tax=Tupaia chinensis TaxID=246437 RepID=L8Y9D1_TUPCH|nr:interleukin-1 receptor type 2 [Tupaia chinensis]XP_014438879.1 interleukin-1 receptor type 2 [Tupaia chinensis]XP_027623329.1 interleukin-1 receptor type 2 [Tupaia chinensis]XP_027623330.1 interleukin-1 receptor type 2 [Tupaia chinensis]XP_027623331.1 interleukin-1 receptor type 2 [Tupaia chinensis]ELV11565.1 Interleukin-1 receptor type 2 [Tupaia chinensis]
MIILYMLIAGASTFTIQPEELPAVAEHCKFRGKYYLEESRVEREPVVLRCPQVEYWSGAIASAHVNVTWHKSNSAEIIVGEEARVRVQGDALWFLPALQEDSGTYICTLRNATYCDEMAIGLRVFENTETSLELISYVQTVTLPSSGLLVCPHLEEFIRNKTDVRIHWYKGSVLLDHSSDRFLGVSENTRLLIHDVSAEDAGYYSCVLTFSHEGRDYNVTRDIELRVREEREDKIIPVLISPLNTISASLGSKLTIPCKVFLGANKPLITLLWWTANNTDIEDAYPGGRVTEGLYREYSENNENYIELPLIFDPVVREDLNTDFKCSARNSLSSQTLHTKVEEASFTFSWKIALAPLSLVLLVLGGMWIRRWCKHRIDKLYGLTVLKTGLRDFQSYPSKIKETK